MEATFAAIVLMMMLALICGWRVLNWLWLKPKKLEKVLREQGLQGNAYRVLVGDFMDILKIHKKLESKPLTLSDDIVSRVFHYSYLQHSVNKHGKNSFIWLGPKPRLTIIDPELVKEVLYKIDEFIKPKQDPLVKLLVAGLVSYEGDKWRRHRRMVNHAFNLEKLKNVIPIFFRSCNDMISKWERTLSSETSCEIDVWPFIQNLASDVISRSAFGSNYEEGKRIFQLLKQQSQHLMKAAKKNYIPGWRFLPTNTKRRMKEIDRDIKASLKIMIKKREKALKEGYPIENDLLSILLESNHKEIEDNNNKSVKMSSEEVIEECKLFYFAGQETTAALLVWTMVLLSKYPHWQERARKEVFQLFQNQIPDFDALTHLKIIPMILYEVLRLYPPILGLDRTIHKEMKLGNLTLPIGVELTVPIILIHHDRELWGDDANEFNPERFSEGVSKATQGKLTFLPFGYGPKVCIGQNFGFLEAKLVLSMILQHFSFELSPTYTHAPTTIITLQPQYGAHLILHKL